MPKVYRSGDSWYVKCPSQGWLSIPTDGRWKFDGNIEAPTFTPSINEAFGKHGQSVEEFRADPHPNRNHFIITSGRVSYCSDCTHADANKSFDLEDVGVHFEMYGA